MNSSSTKTCTVHSSRRSFKKSFHLLSAVVLVLFSFFSTAVYGQIPVTVTNPGNVVPALSGTYTSLGNALNALNGTNTMTGPVIFTLGTGNELAPVNGLTIGSTSLNAVLSATNTVTIVHSGG